MLRCRGLRREASDECSNEQLPRCACYRSRAPRRASCPRRTSRLCAHSCSTGTASYRQASVVHFRGPICSSATDKPYQTNQRGLNLEQSSTSIAVGARGFGFCFCLGKLPASETAKRVGPLLVHLRHQPSTSNPSTRSYRRVRGRSATTTA